MTYTPEYLAWLISTYTERLANEKTTEGKAFLRAQLFNFKKIKQ